LEETIRTRRQRSRALRIALGACLVIAAAAASVPATAPQAGAAVRPPSVVVILTDDQRWDAIDKMPRLESLLARNGVTFTQAYVSNALCCPSRATLLSGRYSHSTGVYLNETPDEGGALLDDSNTVATWLDPTHETALIGKYMNAYEDEAALGNVPQGWDRWLSFVDPGYYNYDVNEDGVVRDVGKAPPDYSTSPLTRSAVSFIEDTNGPLFLWFAPFAPHAPATPAPGDGDAFNSLHDWRPPSYNERNMSDKPSWIADEPKLSAKERNGLDSLRKKTFRSLIGVDRAIERIIAALEATDRLDETMIVFTSDNGLLWGEHRWRTKNIGYEEAIHVPLVIRYDPLTRNLRKGQRVEDQLAVNTDLAPTLADLVDIPSPGVDGSSLIPVLEDAPVPGWRSDFLLEHQGFGRPFVPSFCGIHTETTSYMRFQDGDEELYMLTQDRYQMNNVASDLTFAPILNAARLRTQVLCNPEPPGFNF